MKNDFNFMLINNETRIVVFNGSKVVTAYHNLPNKLVKTIADKLGLYLYGETSYFTGKYVYKIGLIVNEYGGLVNLFTTTSKAKFNKFVCSYVKKAV